MTIKKRILVINLNEQVDFPYVNYLLSQGLDICHSNNVLKGMYQLKSKPFDLVILNVDKPRRDCLEMLFHIGRVTKRSIMVFADDAKSSDLISLLETGADDVLFKSTKPREVLARMNVCLRRSTMNNLTTGKGVDKFSPKETLCVNDISLCMNKREVSSGDNRVEMTGLEFELLHLLMQNAGDVVARDAIGECIFNRNISYCDKSLNMHISNVRKKLSTISQSSKIKTIRGAGYVFI